MKCSNAECGHVWPQGKFCQECGSKLVEDAAKLDEVVKCNGKLEDGSTCTAQLTEGKKCCLKCGNKVDIQLFAVTDKVEDQMTASSSGTASHPTRDRTGDTVGGTTVSAGTDSKHEKTRVDTTESPANQHQGGIVVTATQQANEDLNKSQKQDKQVALSTTIKDGPRAEAAVAQCPTTFSDRTGLSTEEPDMELNVKKKISSQKTTECFTTDRHQVGEIMTNLDRCLKKPYAISGTTVSAVADSKNENTCVDTTESPADQHEGGLMVNATQQVNEDLNKSQKQDKKVALTTTIKDGSQAEGTTVSAIADSKNENTCVDTESPANQHQGGIVVNATQQANEGLNKSQKQDKQVALTTTIEDGSQAEGSSVDPPADFESRHNTKIPDGKDTSKAEKQETATRSKTDVNSILESKKPDSVAPRYVNVRRDTPRIRNAEGAPLSYNDLVTKQNYLA